MSVPKFPLLFLIVVAVILFVTNLGGYDLWPPDEPRFAQVAREMIESGDYLSPRINGHPYMEKPPLLFWAMAAFSLPVGDVTETTARIPSALAGVITIILTYLLTQRLYGDRAAFWAALILISTQRFWWQTRFGQIDMLLTACMTGALYLLWCWHTERKAVYLLGFYLCIAAGSLAKGPPALVFPMLTVLFFYWGRKEERSSLHLIPGFLAVLIVFALWLIPARLAVSVEQATGVSDELSTSLFRQTIGRFLFGVSHANPPWYYLTHLPLDLLPWSLFLPWSLPWVWKHRNEGPQMRFLLSGIAPAFIFFSISLGKRAIYILPLYPAFAILIARSLLELVEAGSSSWRKGVAATWGIGLIAIGLAPLALPFTGYTEEWNRLILIPCVIALGCGIQSLLVAFRTDAGTVAHAMALHFSVLALCVALFVFPALNSHKSARDFCAPLRRLVEEGIDYDLYSLGFSREEYVYYAKHFHEPVPGDAVGIEEVNSCLDQHAIGKKMLSAIEKVVQDVPIASIASVTDEEVARLQGAIRAYLSEAGDDASHMEAYEKSISQLLEVLFDGMRGPRPAFIMVPERDWRWVLALHPQARDMTLLENREVGSRQVLLVANRGGESLVARNQGDSNAQPRKLHSSRTNTSSDLSARPWEF